MPLRWSVLGVGIAGRARSRAIAADPRSRIAAVWRGRFAADAGAPAVETLEEAIDACDAVAICSPDAAHEAQADAALRAGRHVLVEFPLAGDPDAARRLLGLARERRRVLHVEHIELLDPVSVALRTAVRPEQVRHVRVGFERPGPAGAGARTLAQGNVARLHRLVDLAGPVAAIEAVAHEPGTLRATLRLASGAPATLRFRQGPTLRRHTTLEAATDHALWLQEGRELRRDGAPLTLPGGPGLFEQDQLHATARILDDVAPYVSDGRILHVLALVAQLAVERIGPVPASAG